MPNPAPTDRPTLVLPSMVAGRALADALVDGFDVPLSGAQLVLDGTHLVNSSPSFAAQLVTRVLVQDGAAALLVHAAPPAFLDQLTESAAAAGVLDRLVVPAPGGDARLVRAS